MKVPACKEKETRAKTNFRSAHDCWFSGQRQFNTRPPADGSQPQETWTSSGDSIQRTTTVWSSTVARNFLLLVREFVVVSNLIKRLDICLGIHDDLLVAIL